MGTKILEVELYNDLVVDNKKNLKLTLNRDLIKVVLEIEVI